MTNQIKHFFKGGYTVFKGEENEKNLQLAFDHGKLGLNPLAGHGHADTLAIWLSVDGQPVLVDGGTYTYNTQKEWREYFKSTPAHNTLNINGQSSSIMSGSFNWSKQAEAKVISYSDELDDWHIEAEHNGYLERFGLIHKRRLESRSGEIVIKDWLVSAEQSAKADNRNNGEIRFLFHPDLDVKQQNDNYLIIKEDKKILTLQNTAKSKILYGDEEPKGGWYSPSFNQKVPAKQLVFYGQNNFKTKLLF